MYNILVCDDERDITAALAIYLKADGYNVVCAHSGKEALTYIAQQQIHLLLLDVMMPEMDGITALQHLREYSSIPVILLTAKSEDADKILGLNIGADDYITKPFKPLELLARVRSALRRYMQWGNGAARTEMLTIGGICLDDAAKTVTVDGDTVSLTPREYSILKLLMENAGVVFSPKEIYRQIWNEEPYGAENTIAVHIRHLREKIEIDPTNPRYIKVIWGQGYKIDKEWKL